MSTKPPEGDFTRPTDPEAFQHELASFERSEALNGALDKTLTLTLPRLAQTQPRRTIRVGEVAALLGISPASVWSWLRKGVEGFPEPERYRVRGRNVTCWYVEDIEAFAAKQSDMAWRRGVPGPLYGREIIDLGNRALYCADLLDLPLYGIWAIEPDQTPKGTEALWDFVAAEVAKLLLSSEKLRSLPLNKEERSEFNEYMVTLHHCYEVMEGRAAPEIRGPNGFTNAGRFRRGIFKPAGDR